MIDIKESCRMCPKQDSCLKAIENNLNNMFSQMSKERIDCVDFEHFERVALEYIGHELNRLLAEGELQ